MEQQFNHHHSAVSLTFKLAKQQRVTEMTQKWMQGFILRQTGNTTYDVSVESSIWVGHANQLRFSMLENIQEPKVRSSTQHFV